MKDSHEKDLESWHVMPVGKIDLDKKMSLEEQNLRWIKWVDSYKRKKMGLSLRYLKRQDAIG